MLTEDQLCRKYACLILWGNSWEESERLRDYVRTGEGAPGRYAQVAGFIKDAAIEISELNKEMKR